MTLTYDPVLYVIACAAGPAGQVTRLISDARARDWDPSLIAARPAWTSWTWGTWRCEQATSIRSE